MLFERENHNDSSHKLNLTSENTSQVLSHYTSLEESINIRSVNDDVTYVTPVNFSESMNTSRHRWFPYKEGFSPSFVENFIANYCDDQTGTIFDPFVGVGTTGITSARLGFDSIGFDVNPLAIFVAKTKSIVFNSKQIKEFEVHVQDFKYAELIESTEPPDNKTVVSYYEPDYLDAILKIKFYINKIKVPEYRSLFKLSLLSLIEKFSTHRKAGNGVKRKTKFNYGNAKIKPIDEIRQEMILLLNVYISDLKIDKNLSEVKFIQTSSLDSDSYDVLNNISAVITSPPYANCFDYSKIYMNELWLGDFFFSLNDQKEFRNNSIRSHVHSTWEPRNDSYGLDIVENKIKPIIDSQKLWSNKIGSMISGYFKDTNKVLQLMKSKLKTGAPIGFIVSNSFYGGIIIATDLLIAELAEKNGYLIEEIVSFRKMIPSSQQFNKILNNHYMRESLVVFRNV
jgi:hypothetical protein